MKLLSIPLALLIFTTSLFAQQGEEVTLRFLSFPRSVSPEPVELLIGDGETLEVRIPTNALSPPYEVPRLSTWAFGETKLAENDQSRRVFNSFGKAPSIASNNQLILLIRNGKENKDGMRVIPLDNDIGNFGGGEFFFMNAAKVDIAGVLGGTKFALKPGRHTIIEPTEMLTREGAQPNQFFTEFFFRQEDAPRPFFSSTWPANNRARSMVFFYHDVHTDRLRMHTIRDYIP